jgi:hypothetical protein
MQAAIAYRALGDLREFRADYDGARDAQLYAISFCGRHGGVSELGQENRNEETSAASQAVLATENGAPPPT